MGSPHGTRYDLKSVIPGGNCFPASLCKIVVRFANLDEEKTEEIVQQSKRGGDDTRDDHRKQIKIQDPYPSLKNQQQRDRLLGSELLLLFFQIFLI